MKMKRILVPLDLSDFSLEAIEPANSLASLSRVQIYLLHVIPIVSPSTCLCAEHQSAAVSRDAEVVSLHLLEALDGEKIRNAKKLVRVIRRGEPPVEIIRFTRDEDIDLIVIATHGQTGIAQVLIGSVAEEVIRRSPVPVLAVKPKAMRKRLLEEIDLKESSYP